VLIDPDVLQTLPERELRCGMAEVIKHGLIADEDLFNKVIELHYPPNWLDDKIMNSTTYFVELAKLIPQALQVKVNVVEQDPYEQNIRAHLNLGHTFAHAIEQVSGYAWLHGEAVGVGLLAAARLSHRLGLCDASVVGRVSEAIRAVALPQRIGLLDIEQIYAAMATDKKWRNGRSRFVLLEGIGKPTIVENVAESEVMAVLESSR
jgi:3-dehydroquinate synthetase